MQKTTKNGLGKLLMISMGVFSAIALLEALCIMFVPASIAQPVCIGGFIVVAVMSVYTFGSIRKRFINPLIALDKAANDCAMGDMEQPLPAQSGAAEIDGIIRAFAAVQENSQRYNRIIQKISEGELNVEITVKSERDATARNLMATVGSLKRLVADVNTLSEAAVEGKLDARLETEKFSGEYKVIARDFNETLEAIAGPITVGVSCLQQLSVGKDFGEIDNKFNGIFYQFADYLNKVRSMLTEMVNQSRKLTNEAKEGNLNYRADISGVKGGFYDVVQGVNDTLDAIITPIREAEEVLERMSLNDYSHKVTGDYKGSLKEMAECINDVHGRLLSILDVMVRLSKGDTSRLEEFQKVGRRSEQDELIPAAIGIMDTIRNLIKETGSLAQSAYNGDLSVRGNADKFEGAYVEIINGLNKTLEAVAKPIEESGRVLQEVAAGNMTVMMTGDYKGEYVKIKDSINHTVRSFNSILNDINTASYQVSVGAKQVSESSMALSQGATEQASSVQELTASIEEIAVQTQQNAEDANHANKLAETAKDHAVVGNGHMEGMLKAMDEINVSSNNISKIIKVIDDIAFQTNILALNAAVEAARAGQHGKGFTVVAEEVRNLAARSANAANETTDMIKNSIEKVKEGTEIARETATALNQIVSGVTEAAQLVHNIAAASKEQSAAIGQVNQGIMQVSQVVQNNSATSEESAAASEELASQAEVLKEQIGKFKLSDASMSGTGYDELTPDTIKRLEKMFERSNMLSDSPPKSAKPDEDDKAEVAEMGKY